MTRHSLALRHLGFTVTPKGCYFSHRQCWLWHPSPTDHSGIFLLNDLAWPSSPWGLILSFANAKLKSLRHPKPSFTSLQSKLDFSRLSQSEGFPRSLKKGFVRSGDPAALRLARSPAREVCAPPASSANRSPSGHPAPRGAPWRPPARRQFLHPSAAASESSPVQRPSFLEMVSHRLAERCFLFGCCCCFLFVVPGSKVMRRQAE